MPASSSRRSLLIAGIVAVVVGAAVAAYLGRDAFTTRARGSTTAAGRDAAVAATAAPATAPSARGSPRRSRGGCLTPRRGPSSARRSPGPARRVRATRATTLPDGALPGGTADGTAAPVRARGAAPRHGEVDKGEIQTAVREVVPLLAECFELAAPSGGTVLVEMTISGEPGVGTVIDDASLAEGDAHMLEATDFTECLLETLRSVEMPPLTAGGEILIRYPFIFVETESETDDDDAGAGDAP